MCEENFLIIAGKEVMWCGKCTKGVRKINIYLNKNGKSFWECCGERTIGERLKKPETHRNGVGIIMWTVEKKEGTDERSTIYEEEDLYKMEGEKIYEK